MKVLVAQGSKKAINKVHVQIHNFRQYGIFFATWLLNLHKHNGIFRFFGQNDISVIEGGPSDCKL